MFQLFQEKVHGRSSSILLHHEGKDSSESIGNSICKFLEREERVDLTYRNTLSPDVIQVTSKISMNSTPHGALLSCFINLQQDPPQKDQHS